MHPIFVVITIEVTDAVVTRHKRYTSGYFSDEFDDDIDVEIKRLQLKTAKVKKRLARMRGKIGSDNGQPVRDSVVPDNLSSDSMFAEVMSVPVCSPNAVGSECVHGSFRHGIREFADVGVSAVLSKKSGGRGASERLPARSALPAWSAAHSSARSPARSSERSTARSPARSPARPAARSPARSAARSSEFQSSESECSAEDKVHSRSQAKLPVNRDVAAKISRRSRRTKVDFSESDSETEYEKHVVSRRSYIRPDRYDGSTTTFAAFKAHFVNAAEFNGWSEREQLAHLKASLTGAASQCLWDQSPDSTDSVDEL